MKSIWWVVALAVFAVIFLLFPVIEVTHFDKELVIGNETYYEMETDVEYRPTGVMEEYPCYKNVSILGETSKILSPCYRPIYEPVVTHRQVAKTGEVVKVQDISTTERIGMFENLWIHTFSPPFSPIAITGSVPKTSEPFTVNTKEWVIDWAYVPNPNHPEGNFFSFVVTAQGETTSDVESMLFAEETSGSILSHAGPGEYYVTVEATNIRSWGILIKPA